MALNRWTVGSDGTFVCGGFYEPTPGPGQHVTTLPDEQMPDVVNEREDLTSPTKRRPATAAELAAAQSAADEAVIAAAADADVPAAILTMLAARLNVPQPTLRTELVNALRTQRRARHAGGQ